MDELTHENLIKLMRFRPSLKETANWFGVSEDTIERRIKKFEKLTFSEFKDKYNTHTKHKLIDKAIEMALAGNATMMIFTLKNYCGWSDHKQVELDDEPKVFKLAYNPKSLAEAGKDAQVLDLKSREEIR